VPSVLVTTTYPGLSNHRATGVARTAPAWTGLIGIAVRFCALAGRGCRVLPNGERRRAEFAGDFIQVL
jgi:hypothetical protein